MPDLSHLSIEDLLNAQDDIIRLDVDRLLSMKPNETFVPNDGALNTIRAEARRRDALPTVWPAGDEAAEQLARAMRGEWNSDKLLDQERFFDEFAAAVLDRLNRQKGDA